MRQLSSSSLAVFVTASLLGCSGDSGNEVQDDPNPVAANGAPALALLSRPFDGDYPVLNYFDHDIPNGGDSPSGGFQLTWQGERAIPGIHINGYDGHTGIDWIMPIGTPLLAVADGVVVFAGQSGPVYCGLTNETLRQIHVLIRHRASNGETYVINYNHMDRVEVATGSLVTSGQRIGTSGASGCVGRDGTPHLHLNIVRTTNTNGGVAAHVDPYGWQGPGTDPWALHPQGVESVWLWRPGEAPSLVR